MAELLGNDRDMLRAVARGQRNVILCVLGNFLVYGLGLAVAQSQALQFVVAAFGLAILIFAIMSVIKLSSALGKSPVLYVILMFIPCISLIALLVLNNTATAMLREGGVKVGFLGADPNSI